MNNFHRISRSLLLFLLVLPILTVSALAWTPMPELELRILGLDEEPALLEVVTEGEGREPFATRILGEDHEKRTLYTLPAPLDQEFQVHLITDAGEEFWSRPLTHRTYHTSAVLDWEAQALSFRSPIPATVLFFLLLLALPLALEAALIPAFGLRPWWKLLVLIDLVSQALIAQYYTAASLESSVTAWMVLSLFIGQGLMGIIECGLYALLLRKEEPGWKPAVLYGAVSNAAAFLLLALTLSPLWKLVLALT